MCNMVKMSINSQQYLYINYQLVDEKENAKQTSNEYHDFTQTCWNPWCQNYMPDVMCRRLEFKRQLWNNAINLYVTFSILNITLYNRHGQNMQQDNWAAAQGATL